MKKGRSRRYGRKPNHSKGLFQQGEIVQKITASGIINPISTVNIGTQVSGTIAEIFVDYNTPVEQGQLLAQIDPSLFEATVAQRKASLDIAKAEVAVVENDIVYYQKNNILSKENENRILGNIFEFTYDEDVEDDSDTEDDFDELFEEVMSDIEKRLERAMEKCEEDCDCNECLAEKIEHLYAIIDEMENRIEALENGGKKESFFKLKSLHTVEDLLDYLREYC